MYMSDKVDRLFEEIEEENKRSQAAPAAPSEDERALAARLREERQSKISGFKLELDLGDEEEHTPLPEEIHEREETAAEGEPPASPAEDPQEAVSPAEAAAAEPGRPKVAWRCTVCGHMVYEDELPDNFACPVCGVGKDMFERVEL